MTFFREDERTGRQIPAHLVARAIANARVTLACFMRGDDRFPPTAFPEPDDLRRLAREGDSHEDRVTPLRTALQAYPSPTSTPGPER